MAYRPELREPLHFPLRVYVLAGDALVADSLSAALREDTRLICATDVAAAEVVVWDLGPGLSGVPEAQALVSAGVQPGAQALLALVPDDAAAGAVLALGASGVLLRRAHAPTLSAAVIAVRLGLCVIDAALAERQLSATPSAPQPLAAATPLGEPPRTRAWGALDALTFREAEVLEALALGLSNRAIAERLGVSIHTVKFHVNAILAKLGVDSRAGAVAKALRHGLVRT